MSATQELLNQGRYRIEHPISNGNGSSVFSAYDTVSNVNVVVKEIPVKLGKVTTLSQQENNKIAFTNQARQLKDLRHDNLLNVEDYFFDIGRQYLVLESVEGKTIAAFLDENTGPVEFGRSAAWIGQLLSAVDFLSARTLGFVHGKISPENIHIDGDGRVKLMSVGISGDQDLCLDTSLDGSNEDVTNLCFSPLEMIWDSLDGASQKVISNSYDETSVTILHQPPDARSDVYSIGALFYRLVTGTEPIDPLERSIEILESNPDPLVAPCEANADLPRVFSELILKAVALKREDRFDSAAVMQQALKTAVLLGGEDDSPDANEEAEDAKDLKQAVSVRNDEVQKIVEAKKLEFEAEKVRQEEMLHAKLREAEDMRLDAERRAAEAERMLRQQEAARAVTPTIEPYDDLLGISSVDAAPALPTQVKTSVAEKAETKTSVNSIETADESYLMDVAAVETETIQKVAEPSLDVPSFGSAYNSSNLFEEPKRGFPMVAVAGGIALLIVVAIVGWMIFRQSASPVQVAVPQVAEQTPPPTEQVPVETSVPPVENTFIETPVESVEPENTAKAAVATTPEKKKAPTAEPAKAKPETPKKVTVDDLINDN